MINIDSWKLWNFRNYSWRTVLTIVIFLQEGPLTKCINFAIVKVLKIIFVMWSNSGSVLGVCWYTVTGSGHWSLGWKVLGTFSLIPAPTKIPMAIFCQETNNFFYCDRTNFRISKIAICMWRNLFSQFWKSPEFKFEGFYHV